MIGPSDLKACRRGAEWALAAAAAQELGLATALARGPRRRVELADELELDPRGTGILLGVLLDLGLVREDEDGLRLTGQGRARYIDRDAPDFDAHAMRQWRANIRGWILGIEEAVRTGAPPGGGPPEAGAGSGDAEGEDEEAALRRFMAAMANKDPELVSRVVATCRDRLRETGIDPAASRSLDLGGGPGTLARALTAWGGEVVLADRPDVIDYVRAAHEPQARRGLELWSGDFLEDFPPGPFDLVLASNITHIYDRATNAALLERVAAATTPGGIVAIVDFVRGVSEFASLFAITMLLNTERGDTYARQDYEAWLAAAGYGEIRLVSLDPDRQLLTARRRTSGEGGV